MQKTTRGREIMKMRKFLQNKLWRDKAPQLMENMGSVIHIKELSDEEYSHILGLKLLEEAEEVAAAQSSEERMSELADLYEVIDSLMALYKIDKDEVLISQEKKRSQRGGFVERKYVTVAEHPEGSFGESYCLAQKKKYPEIIE